MNLFNLFKKKQQSDVVKPKECHSLKVAKSISEKYAELQACCSVLSSVTKAEDAIMLFNSYSRGWRLWTHTITSAGIDIEEIYNFIGSLAEKRKRVIECELAQLDT